MKYYELKDLDRLVSLTCQKSFETLQRAFATVISELLEGKLFRLYVNKQLDEGDDPNFVVLIGAPDSLDEKAQSADQQLLTQFSSNDHSMTIDSELTDEYILLPILHGHHIYGALIVNHGVNFYLELHANVVLSAITIFSNQMALLQNSSQDALTGLFNRYMLDNAMEHILSVSQSRREEDVKEPRWCLAMLDIDHFKSVNDTYGHLIGDEVLLKLAQLMKKCFRHDDLLFRFGGEEFSILLKDVELEQATRILERFRTMVSDYRFPQVGRVTISLGLTSMTPGKFPSALLGNADKALYYSKEHGLSLIHI